ncbi:MAG: hypothetical protein JXA68_12010 [Ignavibacteriales bacterium]|nr:hypothetical protein [Ignavibacteriales bacterium]
MSVDRKYNKTQKEINFALVEDVRPPIYTAMKYWGKKPHNIWRKYIETYTPTNGICLDPFAGSAISAFESVKVNRKIIAFDLNPLTSFIIEVLSSKFNKEKFHNEVIRIIDLVENDENYNYYFTTKSRKYYGDDIIQSVKWSEDIIYELGIISTIKDSKSKKQKRYTAKPIDSDLEKIQEMENLIIKDWYPRCEFPKSPSFSANFIRCIGGNTFSSLWTKRTLYILAKIFNEIQNVEDINIKKQLLFGFIQSIHLCTKMSVPRRAAANRAFSTSWGRSAYICAKRKMEMNPLLVFKSSCFGKQSVESALTSAESYLGKNPKIFFVNPSNKQKQKLSGFNIKYGSVDINNICDYIPGESIDFIITDPPYGGLVQYLDLSSIWLVWLENIDKKYKPNYDAEITIKKEHIDLDIYKRRFTNGIKNLYKILKNDGKVVFTFHNKNIKIWNAFLNSISIAGFKIEKVIHQQNRRTGEANVSNPYGTSGTDFYIRCIKSPSINIKTNKDEFEHFVISKAIEIIALRNEPTPYQFLFNGLLSEISSAGFDLEDFDINVKEILSEKIGSLFKLTANETNKSGDFWWFVEPKEHIKYPDRLLTDRVEDSIVSLLRRRISVSFDEVLAEIFLKYPNGLTPDIKRIDEILKKYAIKSGGNWLYKSLEIEKDFSMHTEILYNLSMIGQKLSFKIFIGKKEQSEKFDRDKKLSDFCDYLDLDFLNYSIEKLKRILMIDMLWLENEKIKFAIEVENSTNFTSGIQRASNLEKEIPKIMVIPDERKNELTSIKDKLFIDNFNFYKWQYLLYSDVSKIGATQKISINLLSKFLYNL